MFVFFFKRNSPVCHVHPTFPQKTQVLHSSSPDFPVQGTFSAVQMARQGSPLLICARTLKETKDGRMYFCDGLNLPYMRQGVWSVSASSFNFMRCGLDDWRALSKNKQNQTIFVFSDAFNGTCRYNKRYTEVFYVISCWGVSIWTWNKKHTRLSDVILYCHSSQPHWKLNQPRNASIWFPTMLPKNAPNQKKQIHHQKLTCPLIRNRLKRKKVSNHHLTRDFVNISGV